MSAESLVIYDSFAAAMERLRAAMPDRFAFEIDNAFFSNLGLAEAKMKQALMRNFCYEAKSMGYQVHIFQTRDFRYAYELTKRPPVDPAPAAPKPIDEGAIDV